MIFERWFAPLLVLAVILVTVGYFVALEPEAVAMTSSDGVVTVTGLARQTQPFSLAAGHVPEAPLLGLSYTLGPDGVSQENPVALSFRLQDSQRAMADRLNVFRFHNSFAMWEAVSPIVTHTADVITIETTQLGTFALGTVPVFAAPVFANTYDELRAKAPSETVGYEMAVGYKLPGHELVRLLSAGEQGGCSGVVRVGDGESSTRLERQATVVIDDQEETLTFVFVSRWFTSSIGGCTQSELLRPLVEYDILDEIHT